VAGLFGLSGQYPQYPQYPQTLKGLRLLRLLRLNTETRARFDKKSTTGSGDRHIPYAQKKSGTATPEKQKAGSFDAASSIRRLTAIFTPGAKNIWVPAIGRGRSGGCFE